MEVNREHNGNKSNFGLTCSKYGLFFLNIVFLIVSVLAISSGTSTTVALTSYYYLMSDGLDTLITLWLVVGIILLIVALFGIFAAFKESTAAANIYGILMVVVFILQIAVSIFSFTLINQTHHAVSRQLERMMGDYSYESYGYKAEVDWIQSKFECCGIRGPTDWQNFGKYSTPSPYYDGWNNYHELNETQLNQTDHMPVSCCEKDSNYVNLKCEHYHTAGCLEPIHQIVSSSVMMIGTLSLIYSVLQLLGIILGFSYARTLRSKKTQRDMQIWNTDQRSSNSGRQPIDHSTIQW